MLSKQTFVTTIAATLNDRDALAALLDGQVSLPDNVHKWLSRLKLLYGVPYNYLVPDERMLPPESIRFFYVDMNWVDALIDGAYSIGRNLSTRVTPGQNRDAVTREQTRPQVNASAGAIRAEGLGLPPVPVNFSDVVSGFLLRSEIVKNYPGLGVNAYSDETASEQSKIQILRFERLGPVSDTMLCLLLGDAKRIDLHEAPEQLHYGFDDYTTNGGAVQAPKEVKYFTKTPKPEYKVDFTYENGQIKTGTIAAGAFFRKNAPRTVQMNNLKNNIQSTLGLASFNSAEFGFEMTEGVGMVQFFRQD